MRYNVIDLRYDSSFVKVLKTGTGYEGSML